MNSKVLQIEKKRKTVANVCRQPCRTSAKLPQLAGRQVGKPNVLLQRGLPCAQNLFTSLHVDLILLIRKYLTHPKDSLYALMPLLLACKTIYYRFLNNALLIQSIAKDIFSFIHLSTGRIDELHTFRDLLGFKNHSSGYLLTHNESKTKQLLGNARMRNYCPFAYQMDLMVYEYTSLGRYFHLKCVGRSQEVLNLKRIMTEFEETHSAIKLKIYQPYHNNCYPCNVVSNAILIQIDSEEWEMHETCLLMKEGQFVCITFNLSLQLYNFYYRFVLIPERIFPP